MNEGVSINQPTLCVTGLASPLSQSFHAPSTSPHSRSSDLKVMARPGHQSANLDRRHPPVWPMELRVGGCGFSCGCDSLDAGRVGGEGSHMLVIECGGGGPVDEWLPFVRLPLFILSFGCSLFTASGGGVLLSLLFRMSDRVPAQNWSPAHALAAGSSAQVRLPRPLPACCRPAGGGGCESFALRISEASPPHSIIVTNRWRPSDRTRLSAIAHHCHAVPRSAAVAVRRGAHVYGGIRI